MNTQQATKNVLSTMREQWHTVIEDLRAWYKAAQIHALPPSTQQDEVANFLKEYYLFDLKPEAAALQSQHALIGSLADWGTIAHQVRFGVVYDNVNPF